MKRLLGLLAGALLAFAPLSPAFAGAVTLMGAGKAPAGGGGGGYVGPGDLVSGAKAWYGLRAYSAATATAGAAAVRLQRTDTHQCDIALTSTGGLVSTMSNCSTSGDNGTVRTNGSTGWCDGTTCSVATLYDQGSSAQNLVQGTFGTQPLWVENCVNSLPCMQFNGTKYMQASGSTATTPVSMSAVAIRTGTFTSQNDILSGANGMFFVNTANKVGGFWGATASVTANDSAWHALQVVVNGASGVVNVDGTETTANTGSGSLSAGYYLGAQSSTPTAPLTGNITEVGVWAALFTTGAGAQASQVCHNQGAYWGVTVTC